MEMFNGSCSLVLKLFGEYNICNVLLVMVVVEVVGVGEVLVC